MGKKIVGYISTAERTIPLYDSDKFVERTRVSGNTAYELTVSPKPGYVAAIIQTVEGTKKDSKSVYKVITDGNERYEQDGWIYARDGEVVSADVLEGDKLVRVYTIGHFFLG